MADITDADIESLGGKITKRIAPVAPEDIYGLGGTITKTGQYFQRPSVAEFESDQGPLTGNEFARGVARASSRGAGAVLDFARVFTDSPKLKEWADELNDTAEALPTKAASVSEVLKDPSLAPAYVARVMGELAPQAVASYLTAGTGAGLARAAGAGATAQRFFAGAGAAATSIPQEVGGMYRETEDLTGKGDAGAALTYGIPSGMLDALSAERIIGKLFRLPDKEGQKMAWRQIVRDTVKEIPKAAGIEATTESMQEGLALLADKSADHTFELVTPQNGLRVLEAAVAGAIGGGLLGGATDVAKLPLEAARRQETATGLRSLRRVRDEVSAFRRTQEGLRGPKQESGNITPEPVDVPNVDTASAGPGIPLETPIEVTPEAAPAAPPIASQVDQTVNKPAPAEVARDPMLTAKAVLEANGDQFIAMTRTMEGGATGESERIGRSLTDPAQLEQLREMSRQAGEQAMSLMESNPDEAVKLSTKQQFFNEAIGAATGTGSTGEHLFKNEPGYKPPFPEKQSAAPEAPAKQSIQPEPAAGTTGQDVGMLTPIEAVQRGIDRGDYYRAVTDAFREGKITEEQYKERSENDPEKWPSVKPGDDVYVSQWRMAGRVTDIGYGWVSVQHPDGKSYRQTDQSVEPLAEWNKRHDRKVAPLPHPDETKPATVAPIVAKSETVQTPPETEVKAVEAAPATTAYGGLPAITKAKFEEAWQNHDVDAMKALLHLGNKVLRAEFEQRVGRNLPKTVSGTKMAVSSWARGNVERKADVSPTQPSPVEVSTMVPVQQPGVVDIRGEAKAEVAPTAKAKVEQASQKMQAQVTDVAKTEGARPAKEVKSELVQRLEAAIEKAPAEKDLTVEDVQNRAKLDIDIPGDGSFRIWNTKEALTSVLERARKLSTTPKTPNPSRAAKQFQSNDYKNLAFTDWTDPQVVPALEAGLKKNPALAGVLETARKLQPEATESPKPSTIKDATGWNNIIATAASEAGKAVEAWGKHATDVVEPLRADIRRLNSEVQQMGADAARTKPNATPRLKITKKAFLEKYGVQTMDEANALYKAKNAEWASKEKELGAAEAKLKELAAEKERRAKEWSNAVSKSKEQGQSITETAPSTSISNQDLSEAIGAFHLQTPGAPPVTVINEPGKGPVVQGTAYADHIVINQAAISNTAEAIQVLREEQAHRLLSTPEAQAELLRIAQALDPATLEPLTTLYGNDRTTLINEWAAKTQRTAPNLWQRFVQAVRELLAKLGMVELTPEQAVQALFKSLGKLGGTVTQSGVLGYSLKEESEDNEDRVPHQIFGTASSVMARPRALESDRQEWIDYATQLYQEAGLPVHLTDPAPSKSNPNDLTLRRVLVIDPGVDQKIELAGRRLADIIVRELEAGNAGKMWAMAASIRDMIASAEETGFSQMSAGTQTLLFKTVSAEASEAGRGLAALSMFKRDLDYVARHVDVELNRIMGQRYGGDKATDVLMKVFRIFRADFNEAEIRDGLKGVPEMERFVDMLMTLNRREDGSRVYRIVQGLLKEKKAKTLTRLESDAKIEEAAQEIIEQASKLGIEPKPSRTKPLTALHKLLLMVNPENAKKIDGLISQAVQQAERNAGIAAALSEVTGAEREDLERSFHEGQEPTPEQIETGLNLPEHAHWRDIRDNLLDYSPTTYKLAEKVITGEFKGTRFNPAKPVTEDLRIDLAKLAREPDAEVRRVLDGWLFHVEQNMDMAGATVETRDRIRGMIEQKVLQQIAARRQEFLNNFLAPPKSLLPTTASQRLHQLLNAGVENDDRFHSDKVRQLIIRIAKDYVDGRQVAALAVATRAEKQQWLEHKTAEIMAGERFHAEGDEAAAYLEAVTRTFLAEQLQAAEERVTRSFLKGKDVEFDPAPATEAQRQARLSDAKRRVEELIRAGAIDTVMVEDAARKSQVQKLTPTMTDIVRQILDTHTAKQGELWERFADTLMDELHISPVNAEKARVMFRRAFEAKFESARKRALAKAIEGLTPEDRQIIQPGSKKPLWKKLEEAANSGAFDSSELIRRIAAENGDRVPPQSELDEIKKLAERSQQMLVVPKKDLEAAGNDPAKLRKAMEDRRSYVEQERAQLQREMGVRWARITHRIGFDLSWNPIAMGKSAFQNRQNNANALNQFASANLLARVGFIVKQGMQVIPLLPWHGVTRAYAHAKEIYENDRSAGRETRFWRDFGQEMASTFISYKGLVMPALTATRASFRHRSEVRHVENLIHGVNALERAALKAREIGDSQPWAGRAIGFVMEAIRLGYNAAAALDTFQGTIAEHQEIRAAVRTYLRESGMSPADVEQHMPLIFRDMALEYADARQYIEQQNAEEARAGGRELASKEVNERAHRLVVARQYSRMADLEMPAEAIREKIKALREVMAWNEIETGGVGGAVSLSGRTFQHVAANAGIPMPLFAFSNAMGIAINRALHHIPLLAHLARPKLTRARPGEPEASPWFATRTDQLQRQAEQIGGGLGAAVMVGLAAAGLIRVFLRAPRDKEEREKFIAAGHRAGTVEFLTGDGFIPVSITSSPLVMIAPALGMIGAYQDFTEKRGHAQARLNAEALRKGLPPQELPPATAMERMGVIAGGFEGMLMGQRTAAGILGSFTDDSGNVNLTKLAANQLGSLIPGIPQAQEYSKIMGVGINEKAASFTDFLLPLESSGARKLNALGDPVRTPDDMQRLIQVLTGGTYPGVVSEDKDAAHPYAVLFGAGYMPPSISPTRGYPIDGKFRPFNAQELETYSKVRGEEIKTALGALPVGADVSQVRAAYRSANLRALGRMGVTGGRTGKTSRSKSSFRIRSSFRSPALTFRRSRGLRLAA